MPGSGMPRTRLDRCDGLPKTRQLGIDSTANSGSCPTAAFATSGGCGRFLTGLGQTVPTGALADTSQLSSLLVALS